MKFGFSQQQKDQWKDHHRIIDGDSSVGIVLVHGWSAMPKQVLPVAEAINEDGYSVSMPLLTGHGTAPEDLKKVTCEQWINDVVRAVDKMRSKNGIDKVVVGGISMGGSLSLLASLKTQVDGIVLIGTPVHLRNHIWIWFGSKFMPLFVEYKIKKYPKNVATKELGDTSYQCFPTINVRQCLKVIKRATYSLKKVTAPILILQTNSDYMVAKYSPWVIYNSVKSKKKKLQWIKSKNDNHVMNSTEVADSVSVINNFLEELKGGQDVNNE